ncbi:MAG TPA: hypothetical protein VGM37_02005 [Armatimonadota bacterium]
MKRMMRSISVKDCDSMALDLSQRLNCAAFTGTDTFDEETSWTYAFLLDRGVLSPLPDHMVPAWYIGQLDVGRRIDAGVVGDQHWLWVYLSALGPYYSYQLETRRRPPETTPPRRIRADNIRIMSPFGSLPGYPAEERLLRDYFDAAGRTLLGESIVRRRVEGIELEMSEPDEVTVLKCLFFDYDSDPGETILPSSE